MLLLLILKGWLKKLKHSNFQIAHVGAQPLPCVRPTTWRFDLTLRLPAFSSAEDVCVAFLNILKDAKGNQSIPGLKDL